MFTNRFRFLPTLFVILFSSSLLSISTVNKPSKYIKIVITWNKALNESNLSELRTLYASKVLFYCNWLNESDCISNKTSQMSPGKVFEQRIISDIKVKPFGENYTLCEFTKQVTTDEGVNKYHAYLVIAEVGNGMRIVAEGDELTDRRLGFKLTPEYFASTNKTNRNPQKLKSSEENSWLWPTVGLTLLVITLIFVFKWGFRNSISGELESRTYIPKQKVTPTAKSKAVDKTKIVGAYTNFYFRRLIISKFGQNFIVSDKHPRYQNNYIPRNRFNPELLVQFSYNDYFVEFYVHPILIKCTEQEYNDVLLNHQSEIDIELIKKKQFDIFKELMANAPPRIYLALGIGSEAENPIEIYVIPFAEIESETIPYDALKKFRYSSSLPFYFDMRSYKLTMKN